MPIDFFQVFLGPRGGGGTAFDTLITLNSHSRLRENKGVNRELAENSHRRLREQPQPRFGDHNDPFLRLFSERVS